MSRPKRTGYWLDRLANSPFWYIHWNDGKRIRRRSTRTSDREEAEIELAQFVLTKDKPKEAEPERLTVAKALSLYLTEHAMNLPSAQAAGIASEHLVRFYREDHVSDLTPGRQDEYMAQRPVSRGTIDREQSVLRAAMRHCWKAGYLKSVPFIKYAQTALERQDRDPKGRPLSLDEMATLFKVADQDHTFKFLAILAATLCRPGAALDLTPAQIDDEHGLIDLNPKGRRQTKKHRPIVPMVQIIRPWLTVRPNPRVKVQCQNIVQWAGKPISSMKRSWRHIRSEAKFGPDVNPYSIRHTMAREMRKRRVSGEDIAIYLGHKRVDTTTTYAPFDPDYLRDASEVVSETIEKVFQKLGNAGFLASFTQDGGCENVVPLPNTLKGMVGAAGIEPATPTMST